MGKFFNIYLLIGTLLLSLSCERPASFFDIKEDIASVQLQQVLSSATSKDTLLQKDIQSAYRLNNNKLIWFQAQNPKDALKKFFTHFYSLLDEGIEVDRLNLIAIRRLHGQIDSIYSQSLAVSLDSIIQLDVLLTQNYIAAAYMLALGNDFDFRSGDKCGSYAYLNIAKNLVYALNVSEDFPSIDVYRPQNEFYAALVLAIKSWMVIGQDKDYLEAKQQLVRGQWDDSLVEQIIIKELALDSLTEQPIALLIKDFQYYRGLPSTGILDNGTMEALQLSPTDYRKKIKVNLERIRHFPSNNAAILSLNVANGMMMLWLGGQIDYHDEAINFNNSLYQAFWTPQLDSLSNNATIHSNAFIDASGQLQVWKNYRTHWDLVEKIGVKQRWQQSKIAETIQQFAVADKTSSDGVKMPIFIKTYLTAVLEPRYKKVVYYKDYLQLD